MTLYFDPVSNHKTLGGQNLDNGKNFVQHNLKTIQLQTWYDDNTTGLTFNNIFDRDLPQNRK